MFWSHFTIFWTWPTLRKFRFRNDIYYFHLFFFFSEENKRIKKENIKPSLELKPGWVCVCVSCSVVSDSLQPIDCSPPGPSVHRILQARTLEWVATFFSNAWKWKVKVKSLSCVWLFATPWTAAHQAPLSMGFSKQDYWSGFISFSDLQYSTRIYIQYAVITYYQKESEKIDMYMCGEGNGTPLQYCCPENPTDGGAW